MTMATAKATIITNEAPTPSSPPLPGPPTIRPTPSSATTIANAGPRVIGSPSAIQASSAATIGDAACMKRTFATVGVIQRDDERARRDRGADGHAEPGDPHRAEDGDRATTLPDRDEEGQRDEGKERPPGELGRRVDGELALQSAGGRPRNRGRDDVQLPPAPGASCLALGNQLFLRSTGFVSVPTLSISIVTTSPSAR